MFAVTYGNGNCVTHLIHVIGALSYFAVQDLRNLHRHKCTLLSIEILAYVKKIEPKAAAVNQEKVFGKPVQIADMKI